jgi:predicted DsbA family dithiol-disulfide isomerase
MKWRGFWSRIAQSKIVIYADFIDPFCYIGFHNARQFARASGLTLQWRGFELNPATPVGGALLQTVSNSDLRIGMWASVADFGKKNGLTLAEPSMVPNTKLTNLWIQTVVDPDVKNSLIERIYQAYFSDKMDIGDPIVLNTLAAGLGLPQESIRALEKNGASAVLERFRQEAMQHQFAGMPGFVYKGKTHFGALSESAWDDIVKEQKCLTR